MPQHVALIMDGNRRYARESGLRIAQGHEDGFKALQTGLTLDKDFKTFHDFCLNNKIPFNVISAGIKPVLRRVLDHFIGEEASANIGIVSNDAEIDSEGHSWKPVWRHDTPLGHDKSLSINRA